MDSGQGADRRARARESLEREGGDWLLVPASADFRWLTGAAARVTERMVLLALPRRGEPFAVVPRLEADALAHECPWLDLEVWEDGQDPFDRVSRRLDLVRRPTLLLGEGLRVVFTLRFAEVAPCRPAAALLAPLRARKDQAELALMTRAGANADRVVEETADFMRAGMSEREVARFAMNRFVELGDAEPWAIVASGPNAALPHHEPGERRLAEGDVVIVDVGAFTGGYGSDITRTYSLGPPGEEVRKVHRIVDEARAAGVAASRPNAACGEVDRAARATIERAGFGEAFIHRTGHGLGLEVHELPYLAPGSAEPLQPGMVHSVEPGIYLAGRFGVRLEDIVAVTEGAARSLNAAPRDLRPPRMRA